MSGIPILPQHAAEDARAFIDGGFWTDDMPAEWVAGWAAKTPDAPAAIGSGQTLTYGQLDDEASRVASGLAALGFQRGDVIGFQLPNIPEFLVAYIGIQKLGAIPCMVHMPYRAGEIEPLLLHGAAKAIVCFDGLENYDAVATIRELQEKLPGLETVITVGGEPQDGVVQFADLLTSAPNAIANPPTADDPAIMAFTSGTSAAPKAVVHSHRTLSASARLSVEDFGITNEDVVLCAPAHTHAFGLCVALTTLCAGAACAMMPVYTPPALAEALVETGATTFCGGPAHVFAGHAAGLWTSDVTNGLKRSFIGGSACPPAAIEALQNACRNGPVYQIWGMTEVLMGIINPPDDPLENRLKYIGTAPAGHQVRTVNEGGELCMAGEEGELQMRGPFVFAGYYNNPEATTAAFSEDGWFRTGDLAAIDESGNVCMTGRTKDIINRGGVKINPIDIELLMDQHPAVMQSAMIPVPDDLLGEKACLVMVAAPGQTAPTLPEVQAYLTERQIAKLRWPERVEVVDAMPITATRKIIKGKLANMINGA